MLALRCALIGALRGRTMSSRLESLLSDLAVFQVEDRGTFCIDVDVLEDLLAVVEAGRVIASESFPGPTSDHYRALEESIAKLDEVQPIYWED